MLCGLCLMQSLITARRNMYVGRIVAVAKSQTNCLVAMYRISSRSFPNRKTRLDSQAVAVVPKPGFEDDAHQNPFIAYNCLRIVQGFAVVGNGTHVNPIADEIASGVPVEEAISVVLPKMGYESDSYRTPRIVAVADRDSRLGTLGVIRHDGLFVRNVELDRGEAFYAATYEHNYPGHDFHDSNFRASNANEACDYIIGGGVFSALEHPIAAACAYESDAGFLIAHKQAELNR